MKLAQSQVTNSTANDVKFLVKKNEEYLYSGTNPEAFDLTRDKGSAFVWWAYKAALSYAEAARGVVVLRFEDGYEKPVGPDFQHP